MLTAENVCFQNPCVTLFHIATGAFKELIITFIVLHENNEVVEAISRTNLNIIYMTLSHTRTRKLQRRYSENFSTLKHLALQFNIQTRKTHVTIKTGLFMG